MNTKSDKEVMLLIQNLPNTHSLSWIFKTPDDAPKHYESLAKVVTDGGGEPGRFILPAKWIDGRVIIYNATATPPVYSTKKRVLAQDKDGVIYLSKEWIGADVIAFLVEPPP